MKEKNFESDKKQENNSSYFKKYGHTITSLIRDEINKPSEERSRDFKALLLTIVIISVLIFIFWKVPFLNNFLFP